MRDDPRQTAAAENFVAAGAWVSPLALAETSVYELGTAKQARAIEMLLEGEALTPLEPHRAAIFSAACLPMRTQSGIPMP